MRGWAPRAAAAILASSSVAPAAAANRVIQRRVTGREATRHKNKSLVELKSVKCFTVRL